MIDQVVLARFVQNKAPGRSGVRGILPGARKIAFVATDWKHNRPEAGQTMLCRVVHDSDPLHANKGFFSLVPADENVNRPAPRPANPAPKPTTIAGVPRVYIPAPRVVHTEWDVAPDCSDGLERVKVTKTLNAAGGKPVVTSWHVTRPDEGKGFFPRNVCGMIAQAFLSIAGRKRAARFAFVESQLNASLRTAVVFARVPVKNNAAPSPAPVPEVLPPVIVPAPVVVALSGGRDLVVSEIAELERELSFEKLGPEFGIFNVLLDGEVVGVYDEKGGISRITGAGTLRGRKVTISNGDSFVLFSSQLRVYTCERFIRKRVLLENQATPNLVGKPVIAWAEAEKLAVGDVVAQEYPFQWSGNELTNGQIAFTRQRPEGIGAWRKLGVPSVPAPLWEQFLAGLEGKFLVELLPYHTNVTQKRKEPKEERLTPRQRELNAVITGQMFKGGEDCERVALGRNVVFHVKRPNGSERFVVDNPGYGSIYIFDDHDLALSFARGEISRKDARSRGFCRVDHFAGWEEEVATILGAPALSMAA